MRVFSYYLNFIVALICLFLLPMQTNAAPRTVRVGYYPVVYFQEYDQDKQQYRGYSYEYLLALAAYADWKLEFVPLSFQDAMTQLAYGQLDMVNHAPSFTGMDSDKIDYVINQYEFTTICLATNDLHGYVSSGDYATLSSLKVGLARTDVLSNAHFIRFCQDYGSQPQLIYYDTYAQVHSAMETGDIDAFLSCKYKSGKYRVIEEFAGRGMYMAFTKGNTVLQHEYQQALDALHQKDPDFDNALYQKYYRSSGSRSLVLSATEQEYINSHPVINVSYNGNWQPLCFQNKNGQIDGAMAHIYEEISKMTGLKFNFVPANSLVGAFNNFVNGTTQLMADLPYDYTWAEKKKAKLTAPFMRIVVVAAYKNGGATNNVVALPEGFYQIYLGRDLRHNNYIYKEYKNMQQCVEAVLNDEAQYVFLNSYQLEYYRSRAAYKNLAFKIVPDMDYQLATGVSRNVDPRLFSIMDKSIQAIGQDKIEEILRHVSLKPEDLSLWDVISNNSAVGATVFGLLGFLLTMLFGSISYYSHLHQKNVQVATAMATRDRFFANISHDMRSPLNAVLGYLELVFRSDSLQEAKNHAQKAKIAGQLLLQLINDTLDMSKLENNKLDIHPQPMLNEQLIANISSIISPLAEQKGVKFIVKREPEFAGYVEADPLRIQQIFVNLLNNAVKFTKTGGMVQLLCSEVAQENTVSYTVLVKDTGIGITPEYLPKLFDPYSQENRTSATQVIGTGLGMSIVKQLINVLHGQIKVDSTVGKGSTFTVTFELPQIQNYVPASETENKKRERYLQLLAGKKVLLCEDQPINAQLVKVILKEWDMKVVWVTNGMEGLKEFSSAPADTFAAILMDKQMPVMNGLETTRRLRQLDLAQARVIPIIAMTGDADTASVQECLTAGMNKVLTKPLNREDLFQALATMISIGN